VNVAAPREISYLEALTEALREEMQRDERVIVIGEDVRAPIWASGALAAEFPPGRVRNTPISEAAIVGAGVGAAMTGLRPVVDLTIASLIYCAMDQIVNQAAKNRYLFGGQAKVPVVIRSAMLFGGSAAAQHSDRPYPMFVGVPGLKIVVPATPADAKGLLKAAIRDDDPVLCFEDSKLWGSKGPVPDGDHVVPLGRADVARAGTDVTVVTVGSSRQQALAAAEALAPDVSVEVVDVRSLVPFDRDTVLESLARTGRIVVADPAHRGCSMASEIAAVVAEDGFGLLRAPVVRVTAPDIQVPFSVALERDFYPTTNRLVDAVQRVLQFDRATLG
jgi:pyruvate dehydrogenase E1 component beta subunit